MSRWPSRTRTKLKLIQLSQRIIIYRDEFDTLAEKVILSACQPPTHSHSRNTISIERCSVLSTHSHEHRTRLHRMWRGVLLPPVSRRGQIKIATKGNKCQHTRCGGYIAFSNSNWHNHPPTDPFCWVTVKAENSNHSSGCNFFLRSYHFHWGRPIGGRRGGTDFVYRFGETFVYLAFPLAESRAE